ncbi:MAG: hypothetical protein ACREUA_01360 [Burkholderiales bacterium]
MIKAATCQLPMACVSLALGQNGLVGLCSMMMVLLMPTVLVLRHLPLQMWSLPASAPVAVLALVPTLYSIDNLFNAMLNTMFTLIIGGICTLTATAARGRWSET